MSSGSVDGPGAHAPDSDIAAIDLVVVAADGERRPVRVRVGCPAPDGRGAWACPIALDGLHDRMSPVLGEDALQALCLALGLAARLLRDARERGGRLEHPDGDEFPLESYFVPWAVSDAPRG